MPQTHCPTDPRARTRRTDADAADARRHPRKPLPAGYADVRVRRAGQPHFQLTGHAYDISRGGVRFELDEPLECGEQVEIEVRLPEARRRPIRARGVMVRLHEADEVGPVRMGLQFTALDSSADRAALDRYLAMPDKRFRSR